MAASYGARVWLALGTIYVVWGSTFIALAIAVRDLPPFLSMALRHLAAGAILPPGSDRRPLRQPPM